MQGFCSANRKRFAGTVAFVTWAMLALTLTLTMPTATIAQGPALTTISDTVYRADGTPASGTALISWPSFQTASGNVVAAGTQSIAIGPGGAFVAQLTPNVGAAPVGTYYVVVYQLDDGTVRTEYWSVPTTSPVTISEVRTTPGTGLANTVATEAYVNQAVQNVGSGSYVSKAGDTMTGPLTLPGPPTAPGQASDKQYVDSSVSVKADLLNGVVPTSELGTGAANSSTCLTGNSTWGSCGGGAPAGITYATTALNWSQTLSSALTGGTQATVTLTPCPVGIDTTSGAGYDVLIAGGGNSEAAGVATAAGGCTSGAASGTITFTPFFSYPAGSTIGSASGGLQETLNAACGTDPSSWKNTQCNVTIPANGPGYPNHLLNTYNIAGTLYWHANQSVLNGYGVSFNCNERGPCLQVGDLINSNDYANDTVFGLSLRTPTNLSNSPAFAGTAITQTQRTSQVVTVTTAAAHGFRPGDMVTILFTDNNAYWGDAVVTSVPNSTTFQYAHSGADIPAQSTPGVAALAYVAILDNGLNTHLTDISYDKDGENGAFNNFFDMWDDENAAIDHFNNNAISLNASATWTGSFIFSAGNQGAGHQVAPVITLRDSTITANFSNGLTVYNSNGVYVENTVLQSTGPWQVYSANSTGNYQGAYLKNIYSESSTQMNPLTPARSPFAGTGIAGLIAGPSSGAAEFNVAGTGPVGYFATGGSGSINYSYFVVAKDKTAGTQTSPMQVLNYGSTGSDAITVRWPRVANGTDAIAYDLIRTTTPGVGGMFPYNGGCGGGATTTCGSVATNLSQCTGLVCSYTDNGATIPVSYTISQGNYTGNLVFWPGSIVTSDRSVSVDMETSNVVGIGLTGNAAQIANLCSFWGATSPGGYTDCYASMTAANNGVPNQTATLMTDGPAAGGGVSLSKGRLNFSTSPSASLQPHHIITLIDSQPGLTRATWGYRPAANATDTWIGTDVISGGVGLTQGQLAFGAPVAITNYIAATGDGIHANWLERLTGNLKELNVAVKFDQSVTLSGLADGCLNVASGVIGSTGTACGSGGGGGGGSVTSVFGRTGAVVGATGDYSVAQVTGAAADAAVVHNTGNETIAGAKTFTNNVAVSGNLLPPSGSGYVPAIGGIGLDTNAGLPVVNMNGTVQQVAFTSSNITGQAGTALALAQIPTQCSGAFATGIAANGNANCTTPNVIQLAETAQPAGIPNWGVFWFDAATHTPRVIENNGPAIQLGLSNLFNSDPGGDPNDNLEERNGLNAQNLRVYSTYTSTNTWDRVSLGSEALNGTTYNVLRSEDASSGNAPGIGIHIGSAIKWMFGPDGSFKPNPDNSYDMGTDSGQAVRSVFAKTSFNMYANGRQDFEYPNDGTTGTGLNLLAIYNGAGSGAETASTGSSDGVVGVVSAGAGTTGKAVITWAGYAACNFDAANPAVGDYVTASTTQGGKCHDTGSTSRPSGVQVIGRIETGGGVRVTLAPPSGGAGGGAVSSVFGRTGAVTAQSGDYSVGQITGAAPLASPSFSGVLTHPDGTSISSSGWAGTPTFLSNVTINGNLTVAGGISQSASSPTQWSGKEWTSTTATVPSGMDYSIGVGSDGAFKCQLASGASCMGSGGAVSSVFGRTGAVTAQSGDYSVGQITGAVANTITVNGHALSGNVVISASDITTGTLPHAQLPALQSGDIPNNTANTTGTSAGLSGTPALPSGTTATTQGAGDNSSKLATTAYVDRAMGATWVPVSYSSSGSFAFSSTANKAAVFAVTLPYSLTATKVVYRVGTADSSANAYAVALYNASGALVVHYAAAGTSFAPTANAVMSQAWSEGATVLAPGKYFMLWTSSCTTSCATINAQNAAFVTSYSNTAFSVTTGGTAPASIAPGTGLESFGATAPAIIVE